MFSLAQQAIVGSNDHLWRSGIPRSAALDGRRIGSFQQIACALAKGPSFRHEKHAVVVRDSVAPRVRRETRRIRSPHTAL